MADTSLPPFLHPFFWEYDPANIDTVRHASLIMGRIMERGSWEAMRWLKQRYSHAELTSFLRTRGIRILPPRELNYWSLICGIPDRTRKQWLKKTRTRDPIWLGRHAH